MEPLPPQANLLTTLLLRVRNVLDVGFEIKRKERWTPASLLEDGLDAPYGRIDKLVRDATFMWEDIPVQGMDPRQRAEQQLKAAEIYAAFRRDFHETMEAISKLLAEFRFGPGSRQRILLVLPIDRLYSSYRIDPELRAEAPPGRPELVENRIRELSGLIFRRSYEPQVLAEVHHVLHQLSCAPVARVSPGVGLDGFARGVRMLDPEHVRFHEDVRDILYPYRDYPYRDDEGLFLRGQQPVDIALSAGYPERVAIEWLERIRRTGLDARFTVAWLPTADALARQLLDVLDDYLQRPRSRYH